MRQQPDISPLVPQVMWIRVANELEFTPRQTEIVWLVLHARKDKQIAVELGMRLPTVRMHLRHLFARFDITDRMELALVVFRKLLENHSYKE